MAKHCGIWPVRLMCKLLEVSRGGYYAFLKRPPSARAREDERILVARSLATMTPERATEFRRRLVALQEEFCGDTVASSPGGGTRPWGVVLAVYPLPETSTPTDSDPTEPTDD